GNPVSALIGYASLIQQRLAQGKDVSGYAERIEREGSRIDRILRDLLDLARSAVAPRQIAVETALPADLPPVRADEHYLSQVFLNLMTNAARAGASRVRVAARAADGGVRVDVEDDGRGIPADALPRLFEPF